MLEHAALSLLLGVILQRGRGWKRGEGRGSCCTRRPTAPVGCTTLHARVLPGPLPTAPRGVHAHRGMLRTPHPTTTLSPGHLLSISSPHSPLRQMQQLFSLFRLQQKPLQAHKGEEQKRSLGLNKSHLPEARVPHTIGVLPPRPALLCRTHFPAAKILLGTLISRRRSSEADAQGQHPGCRGKGHQHDGDIRDEGGGRGRVGGGCETHGEKSKQVNGNKAAARSIPADSRHQQQAGAGV